MSRWMDNVPQFDWWDYNLTGFGRTPTLISEATLPLGCRAQVSAYSHREGFTAYVSSIVTYKEQDEKEARSLEEAKRNARESWIGMLAEAIGDSGAAIKPLSWAEQDGDIVAYGVSNMGFIVEKGSDGYIVLTAPEQQYTKSHFGFETIEDAKAWCDRYNKDLVEEAMEWVK